MEIVVLVLLIGVNRSRRAGDWRNTSKLPALMGQKIHLARACERPAVTRPSSSSHSRMCRRTKYSPSRQTLRIITGKLANRWCD
jgi:hypothetical protein